MFTSNPNEQQQFGFLDILAIVGFIMQMANYQQNSKQTSNDDLMKEMRQQDQVYFKKIIQQNEEILKIIKKEIPNMEL